MRRSRDSKSLLQLVLNGERSRCYDYVCKHLGRLMKISPTTEVQALYDGFGDSYAEMMDAEIETPLYVATFSRLAKAVEGLAGPILDTSCGSGHMLSRYHERYEPSRPLIGMDLSPSMVAISKKKLGDAAEIHLGDMRDLSAIATNSAAAVVSFFALHHLSPEDAQSALAEWHRVLRPGGFLILGTWEGKGAIDYGGESDLVALRYSQTEVSSWAEAAGFRIDRCVVEAVEEMPMDAVYLDATKA